MDDPWNIESIYELQYFNCPNCVYKNHSKQLFVDHAFFYHPQSISSLTNLKDDSLDDVVIDISDVKTETKLLESVRIKIEPELIEPIVEIETEPTEHEQDSNYDIYDYKCQFDPTHNKGQPFQNKDSLRSHYNKFHDCKKPENFNKLSHGCFQCQKCNHKTETVLDMEKHEKTFHETKKVLLKKIHKGICILADNDSQDSNSDLYDYKCKFDPTHNKGQPFHDKHSLRIHYNKFHEGEKPENFENLKYQKRILYQCQECKFSSFSLNHLKAHIEMQHDSKLDPLTHYDLDKPKDDSPNDIKLSMNTTWIKTEIDDDDPVQVNNTSNQNTNQSQYYKLGSTNSGSGIGGQEHIDDPLDTNSYIFDDNDNNHKEHISLVHNEKKRHTCDKCGKTFGRSSELNRHYSNIHEEKNINKCEYCNKDFVGNLQSHVDRVHKNIRNFECKECGNRFFKDAELKTHIDVVHKKLKPFKCELCPYRAINNGKLNYHHKLVHENVRPYPCEECGMGFKTNYSLKRHVMVVHTGLKPYECDMCPFKTAKQDSLNNHKLKVHQTLGNFPNSKTEINQ